MFPIVLWRIFVLNYIPESLCLLFCMLLLICVILSFMYFSLLTTIETVPSLVFYLICNHFKISNVSYLSSPLSKGVKMHQYFVILKLIWIIMCILFSFHSGICMEIHRNLPTVSFDLIVRLEQSLFSWSLNVKFLVKLLNEIPWPS